VIGVLNISNCYWALVEDYDTDNVNHFNIDGGLFVCNRMIVNGNSKKKINFFISYSKPEGRLPNRLINAEFENMVLIFIMLLFSFFFFLMLYNRNMKIKVGLHHYLVVPKQ
jgi:hypothetical protein